MTRNVRTGEKPYTRGEHIVYIWLLAGLGLFAVGVAACYLTGFDIRPYLPVCIFHRLTGYYCPGCGGTRSVFYFFQGDLVRSFLYYPLVPVLAFAVLWFLCSHTVEFLSGKRFLLRFPWKAFWLYLFLAIIVGNFAVKNIVLFLTGSAPIP